MSDNKDKLEQIRTLIKDYPEIYKIRDIVNNEMDERKSKTYLKDKVPPNIFDELKNEYLDLAKGLILNVKCQICFNYYDVFPNEMEEDYEKFKFSDNEIITWGKINTPFNIYYLNEKLLENGKLLDILKTQEEKFSNFRNKFLEITKTLNVEQYDFFIAIQEEVTKELGENYPEKLTYSIE